MITTIILAGILGLTILFLASAILHIHKIQNELEELNKEQHTQNMDIIEMMKKYHTHSEMIVQHIEILKYLIDQDPKINTHKIIFPGPMGEA
jgi:DNA-binding protein H-NS